MVSSQSGSSTLVLTCILMNLGRIVSVFFSQMWGFSGKLLPASTQPGFTGLVGLHRVLNKTELWDFSPILCCYRYDHIKKSNRHCGLKSFGMIVRVFLMRRTFFKVPSRSECYLLGFFGGGGCVVLLALFVSFYFLSHSSSLTITCLCSLPVPCLRRLGGP